MEITLRRYISVIWYWLSAQQLLVNRSRVRLMVEPAVDEDKKFRMVMRNFGVKKQFGSDGVRTRAGLVLLLACSEAFNHGVVSILAQRIV